MRQPYYRKILLVNRGAQLRTILYGVFAAIVGGVYSICLDRFLRQGEMSAMGVPLLIGVFVFALVVLLGLVVSGQVAGPIHRLHRNLRKLRNGEKAEKIHIRKGDAYGDMFADYNLLVDRIQGTREPK